MLVLSRRERDSIMIGHDTVVTVLSIHRDHVRLGIQAPRDVEVHREEVYKELQRANQAAASSTPADLDQLADVLTVFQAKRPREGEGPPAKTSEAPGT